MPAYTISNLIKRFGRTTALDDLSFHLAAGEFVVVLGPTGAGKTTLLRTLAGLEKPDAGTIIENTSDITHLTPAARDMAMVFQNFSLYPRKTVRENLAFGLRPAWRNIPEEEITRRVIWAAELLGLTEKLAQRPTELSGGQQQRVAIGRAIVREPKLFLFDEPLASLDAKLRESMTLEIHRLQRRLNVTMLYVTHDSMEAMSLADRIIVLDQGRILQIGAPHELYNSPASPRVGRMLGTPPINLLPTAAAKTLFPSLQPPENTQTIGIRPEHLTLTRSPDGTAKIRVIEHLGATTIAYLHATAAGESIELRATLGPTTALQVGDHVTLSTTNSLAWPEPLTL